MGTRGRPPARRPYLWARFIFRSFIANITFPPPPPRSLWDWRGHGRGRNSTATIHATAIQSKHRPTDRRTSACHPHTEPQASPTVCETPNLSSVSSPSNEASVAVGRPTVGREKWEFLQHNTQRRRRQHPPLRLPRLSTRRERAEQFAMAAAAAAASLGESAPRAHTRNLLLSVFLCGGALR